MGRAGRSPLVGGVRLAGMRVGQYAFVMDKPKMNNFDNYTLDLGEQISFKVGNF